VAERGDLVAFVPPAPRQPYETWIVAMCPEPYFHAASPERIAAIADLTRDLVGRLERLAPGCHYNWWLHQAPFPRSLNDDRIAASWHWHLEIVPRLSEFAGFEIGTGCHITTRSAEESARMLRAAVG
jgi:UDPglucose--hexose-1-phosphate uridylyltransferase